MAFELGRRIEIQDGLHGTVRYVGPVPGKAGEWVGLELNLPVGSNDGTYQGTRYFPCAPDHGLFVRTTRLRPLPPQSRGAGSVADTSYVIAEREAAATASGHESLFGAGPGKEQPEPMGHRALCVTLLERFQAVFKRMVRDLAALQRRVDGLRARRVTPAQHRVILALLEEMHVHTRAGRHAAAGAAYKRFSEEMARHGITAEPLRLRLMDS